MATVVPKKPGFAVLDALPDIVCAGGGDVFAAPGAKYLFVVKNAHTSPQNVVLDDPNTQQPAGATTFNPDATFIIPNATTQCWLLSDVGRFRNPAGNINVAYSGVVALTMQIFEIN
jgi:hypothetical protein